MHDIGDLVFGLMHGYGIIIEKENCTWRKKTIYKVQWVNNNGTKEFNDKSINVMKDNLKTMCEDNDNR